MSGLFARLLERAAGAPALAPGHAPMARPSPPHPATLPGPLDLFAEGPEAPGAPAASLTAQPGAPAAPAHPAIPEPAAPAAQQPWWEASTPPAAWQEGTGSGDGFHPVPPPAPFGGRRPLKRPRTTEAEAGAGGHRPPQPLLPEPRRPTVPAGPEPSAVLPAQALGIAMLPSERPPPAATARLEGPRTTPSTAVLGPETEAVPGAATGVQQALTPPAPRLEPPPPSHAPAPEPPPAAVTIGEIRVEVVPPPAAPSRPPPTARRVRTASHLPGPVSAPRRTFGLGQM